MNDNPAEPGAPCQIGEPPGMGLGVAYGIWGATGVVLTAVFATALFGDPLTATMGVGIALVIGGVLCVELGSQAAADSGPADPA